MSDLLVEIKRKDWHFLRNLYHQNSDEHYIAYTTIENCIRVVEQDPNVKHINLFCLNGDFNDGSFVMIVSTFTPSTSMNFVKIVIRNTY